MDLLDVALGAGYAHCARALGDDLALVAELAVLIDRYGTDTHWQALQRLGEAVADLALDRDDLAAQVGRLRDQVQCLEGLLRALAGGDQR